MTKTVGSNITNQEVQKLRSEFDEIHKLKSEVAALKASAQKVYDEIEDMIDLAHMSQEPGWAVEKHAYKQARRSLAGHFPHLKENVREDN